MQVSARILHLDKSKRLSGCHDPRPLARRPVCAGQTARILRAVLPPFNGGLHCGCDRQVGAGHVPWCSRLSTAGSIAAVRAPGHATRPACAPAFQRRAPLRRATSSCTATDRCPGAPAFQRRAPLRRAPRPRAAARRRQVLPPFNGGLHCGCPQSRVRRRGCDQRAPAFQRRAPLRQDGARGSPHARTVGAPAFQRRAPLRPRTRTTRPACRPQVLPPFNGGLHCGGGLTAARPATHGAPAFQRRAPLRPASTVAGPTSARPVTCSRLSTAGSIAAGQRRPPCLARRRRAPAFQRRAPLRPDTGRGLARVADACSRLSTAGSIAAACSPAVAAGRDACSRLSTAGSIAARSRRVACGRPHRVLPPFNGGLHCGGSSVAGAVRDPAAGAPAFQRRAPLRRQSAAGSQPLRRVLPPFNGGLHCGPLKSPPRARRSGLAVLPPFNGGLHCGATLAAVIRCRAMQVLPPFNGGLHCGAHCRSARPVGMPVLPPFNGGLHCGTSCGAAGTAWA